MNAREKLIEHYFLHLESKLEAVRSISKISEEEALVLCCCYIEALGARQYQEISYVEPPRKSIPYYSKSAAFTKILAKHSGFDFWDKIHPIGLLDYLPKSFNNNYQDYMIVLSGIGCELREKEFIISCARDIFQNAKQKEWFENNAHKGSVGYIAYSKVRSEIVHNITHEPITFMATWNDQKIPDINYCLMEESFKNIIESLKKESREANKFWWEQ